MMIGSNERYVVFVRNNGRTVVLWDWEQDQTQFVTCQDELSGVHIVKDMKETESFLVGIGQDKLHVWDASEPFKPFKKVQFMKTVPLPPGLERQQVEMLVKSLNLGLEMPERVEMDQGLVDICRHSDWLTLGATKSEAVWLKQGQVMCSFSEYLFGPTGRKYDAQTKDQEEFMCIAANDKYVCLATDFGNLYLLDKKEMKWIRTLPLGVVIQSMTMPGNEEALVALQLDDDTIRVVNCLETYFVDFDEEAVFQNQQSQPQTKKVVQHDCRCCGKQHDHEIGTTNDIFVCRDLGSGETIAHGKRTNKRWTVVPAHDTTCNKIVIVKNQFVVVCGKDTSRLEVFFFNGQKGKRVADFELDGPCVDFDVDHFKKNRIIALSKTGNVHLFAFSQKRGPAAAQVIQFKENDKPRFVAAHSGKIAIADDDKSVMVLLNPGQGDHDRKDFTCTDPPIKSIAWQNASQLVVNGIEKLSL